LLKFSEAVEKKLLLSTEERIESYANQYFDCASNHLKAEEIAKTLVQTWKSAKDLANANGAEFIAVLQPHAYTNKNALEDPRLALGGDSSVALSQQFDVVYPLIRKYANDLSITFLDFSHKLDGCTDCYFDFCHLTPSGNKSLATYLVSKM